MAARNSELLVRVVADGTAAKQLDLAQLARLHPARYPFLLESVAVSDARARFDILFAFPGATLELSAGNELSGPHANGGDFLAALDGWWTAERADPTPALAALPFRGGWFVYLGYELAGQIEPGLALHPGGPEPLAFATRVPLALIRDHGRDQVLLVAEPGQEARQAQVLADLQATAEHPPAALQAARGRLVEDQPAAFLAAVTRAQRYITAGDNYQTNLSRCWRVELAEPLPPAELYLRLRQANPAPFAGLLQHARFAVVASSPERLVRRVGERIDTRPIAGTHPRTGRAADAAALLAHPKERAEHVMLIDLERNDLGRICRGGSVRVDEFMVVESYTHVHHIVSNVSGAARPGLGPGELLRAVFPGGTITGCPKVRTMQIIAELEQRPRGAYTGSFGYLNRDGDCDFNILIRTITQRGRELEIAAGSGIVADSIPQRELAETRSKAKGMLLSLDRPGDEVLT
jgi:anthranilate synthase component 1